jgi:amidase
MTSLARDTQWMDATALAELVRSRQVTPSELLEAALERTENAHTLANSTRRQTHHCVEFPSSSKT